MSPRTLRRLATLIVVALWATPVFAADLILRPQPSVDPATICARYGFTMHSALDSRHLYLVWGADTLTQADLDAIVANDRDVQGLEFSKTLKPDPMPGGATLTQSIAGVLESYETTFVNYYGANSWDYYVTQSAGQTMHLNDAHAVATGTGVIALIDTGVDPFHPALQNALVPGYDFTHEAQGYGSEWSDMPNLQQSIAGVLEQYGKKVLVDGDSSAAPPLPEYFGHGTMVAGIIHLTAPTSKIMPLKAFTSNGDTTMYQIVRAIYYAVEHGARAINMSFVATTPSRELQEALQFAAKNGVTTIAAVGNNGLSTDAYPVYPADYGATYGIGSTTAFDSRSTFSNYGVDVEVGAPGEQLITAYPGGLYAAVWGTSFSAGWASGSVGLFLQRNPALTLKDSGAALSNGAVKLKPSEGMGAGRLDLYKAVTSVPVK